MKEYRHELKYYISRTEYEILSRRLAATMKRDPFAAKKEDGRYHVRSLYFDDYEKSAVTDKLSGNEVRDKYRIRIYDISDETIKLERKHKEGPYIQKTSINLTRADCDRLLSGDVSPLFDMGGEALTFYAAFRTKNLKPCVLVDYIREPYIFDLEDVRITFDMGVKSGMRRTDIFNKDVPMIPVIEDYGMVLEVKFNRYLPSHIRSLIQPQISDRSAISKYLLARKFQF